MTTTDLLLSIVTSLLSRVPVLIALVLGLVLVWRTPPVAARRAALARTQDSSAARRAAMSVSTHESSTGWRSPSSTWSRL